MLGHGQHCAKRLRDFAGGEADERLLDRWDEGFVGEMTREPGLRRGSTCGWEHDSGWVGVAYRV